MVLEVLLDMPAKRVHQEPHRLTYVLVVEDARQIQSLTLIALQNAQVYVRMSSDVHIFRLRVEIQHRVTYLTVVL